MSISKKAAKLQELLERNGLLKKADVQQQKVEHMSLEASQPTIGNEMQKEVENGNPGTPGAEYASDKNVDAKIEGQVLPAPDSLYIEGDDETPAKSVLGSTGTPVKTMTAAGNPTTMTKSESLNQKLQAVAKAEMQKQAAYQQAVDAHYLENPPTATETMHKIAALANSNDPAEQEALAQDIEVDFVKLAAYNPLFRNACEYVKMRKIAEEIDALAAAQGISPEEAASALDEAMAADPGAEEEFNNEVEGDALSELAGAEGETADLMAGLEDAAAQASEMTGTEITPDDLIQAASDVVDQAEAMGVEPQVLIQAAAEELAQGGDAPVSDQDYAQAEQLMQEAADQGISPEEVLQAATADVGADEGEPAPEVPAEEPAAVAEDDGEGQVKEACLRHLATTRRGQMLARMMGANC